MNVKALEMATLALAHEARFKNETAGFGVEDAETLARIALEAAAPWLASEDDDGDGRAE